MKKMLVWLLMTVLLFSGSAYAFELGDMLGGITSLFAPDAQNAYGPQELAELDGVNIKLVNVMESKSSNMYDLKDGYEFLIIEFSIENKDSENLTLSTMMNFSTWCDGNLCTISLEALATAMFTGKTQLDCVIEPGKSYSGVIGYEVPIDWNEIIVEYKGEMIGGDKASFVVTNKQ